jgi:hypothetical protein
MNAEGPLPIIRQWFPINAESLVREGRKDPSFSLHGIP